MQAKLQRFLREPLINKITTLSNAYYRLKTLVFYRFMFQSIGKHVIIRKPILITNPQFITIADNVFIRDGIRLEVIQPNRQRTPQLSIGSNTNIEQHVHIICHSNITIGSNVSITGHCSIVDVTHPYADMSDTTKIGARILDEDSFVEIGDGSFIGFGSVILPNVKIGKYVVIGAHSVVVRDIPDYSIAAGAPAKVIKQLDRATGTWMNVND